MTGPSSLVVGFAQIAPVWFNRKATIDKVVAAIHEAADQGAQVLRVGLLGLGGGGFQGQPLGQGPVLGHQAVAPLVCSIPQQPDDRRCYFTISSHSSIAFSLFTLIRGISL